MFTEDTELSRTSVADFLRLVGNELERASAFLSRTHAKGAPIALPPAAPPAAPVAMSPPAAVAPALLRQEPAAPAPAAPQEPPGGHAVPEAEAAGSRELAVSSRSTSFVRFTSSQQEAARASVASGGGAQQQEAPRLSRVSASSAGLAGGWPAEPEATAVVSRSASFVRMGASRETMPYAAPAAPGAAEGGSCEPPASAAASHNAASSSSSSSGGDDGGSRAGEAAAAEEEEELAKLVQLVAPGSISLAAAVPASGPDPPPPLVQQQALAVTAPAMPQPEVWGPLPVGPAALAPTASPSKQLRALRSQEAWREVAVPAGQQPSVGTAAVEGGLAQQQQQQQQPHKSHIKVLRWLRQTDPDPPSPAAPAYSPAPAPLTLRQPALGALPSNHWQQRVTAPEPPLQQYVTLERQSPGGQPAPHVCSADRVDYCGQVLPRHCQRRQLSVLVRLGEGGGQQQAQCSRSPLKLLRPGRAPAKPAGPPRRAYSAGMYSEEAGPAKPVATADNFPERALQLYSGPQQQQPAAVPRGGPGITIGSIHTAYFGSGPPLGQAQAHGHTAAATAVALSLGSTGASGGAEGPTGPQAASAAAAQGMDMWAAYLAQRHFAQAQQEGGGEPGDALGQLRAISSRISRMQDEITGFLVTGRPSLLEQQEPPLLHLPATGGSGGGQGTATADAVRGPHSGAIHAAAAAAPAASKVQQRPANAGGTAGNGAQPSSRQQAAPPVGADGGLFDDNFIMSLKMGTDYQALQKRAAAAASSARPGGSTVAALAGGGGRASSAASDRTEGGGWGEAIDRLKGLRASQGARRVAHDSSVPVVRVGSGRRG